MIYVWSDWEGVLAIWDARGIRREHASSAVKLTFSTGDVVIYFPDSRRRWKARHVEGSNVQIRQGCIQGPGRFVDSVAVPQATGVTIDAWNVDHIPD